MITQWLTPLLDFLGIGIVPLLLILLIAIIIIKE